MRYYTVHLPRAPRREGPAEGERDAAARRALSGARFVRESFDWTAFFFSIAWAIGHGLWLGALLLAAALALILGLSEILALDWGSRAVLLLGYATLCGFNANDWRRLGLRQGAWELVGVIAARDRDHAFLRLARLLSQGEAGDATAARPTPAAVRLDSGPSPGFWS